MPELRVSQGEQGDMVDFVMGTRERQVYWGTEEQSIFLRKYTNVIMIVNKNSAQFNVWVPHQGLS